MTDDEIRRLLALKSEGPNLDYKAGFEWSKQNRDLKYELVRDLIALANTKDGGRVVFGVRDSDLELVGVSVEIFESIDPTDAARRRSRRTRRRPSRGSRPASRYRCRFARGR